MRPCPLLKGSRACCGQMHKAGNDKAIWKQRDQAGLRRCQPTEKDKPGDQPHVGIWPAWSWWVHILMVNISISLNLSFPFLGIIVFIKAYFTYSTEY